MFVCFLSKHEEILCLPHGLGLQDATTPEYAEFEEYPDNTFDPENQEEEDDYPLTGGDFHQAPSGGDPPASPDAPTSPSEDSGLQVSYGSEDVPLTSEPRYSSEPAERQYAPPNPAEGGAREQQPQVTRAPFTLD